MQPGSCSRRWFIGVAVAVPVVASAAAAPRTNQEWHHLRAEYDLARSRHELFLAHDASVADGSAADIQKAEEYADELCSQRFGALFALVESPAPSLDALRVTFRHVYEDLLQHEDHEHLIGSILADLERLGGY